MTERADVLRVQNDALLNEYHHLIRAQIRRIDEALAALNLERGHLMAERDHLAKHLPTPEEHLQGQKNVLPGEVQWQAQEQNPVNMSAARMPKFIQKGPAT